MKFLLEDEHNDLAASIRALCERSDVSHIVRALHGTEPDAAPTQQLWHQLAETGVTALLIDDANGGVGAGALEMVVAAHQLGKYCVPGPVAEMVGALPAAVTAAGTAAIGSDLVDGLLGGTLSTIAMPPHQPYAVSVAGLGPVPTLIADNGTLAHATLGTAHDSVDRTRSPIEVTATTTVATDIDTAAVFNAGVLATAAQLIGLGQGVVDMAAEYAKNRKQFGVPIGSFQAVKHHLADVVIALEMAQPLVYAAALAIDGRSADGVPDRDVSAAKVAAADAAYLSARTGLQVLGAIGYTMEHDLSLYLTKIRALVNAWGTPAFHRSRVRDSIVASTTAIEAQR